MDDNNHRQICVSKIENDEYIYTNLNTIDCGWNNELEPKIILYNQMGIVKKGFEKATFYLDDRCPWFQSRIAVLFKSTKTPRMEEIKPFNENINFNDELELNPFPYLNIYIKIIQNAKEVTPEYLKQSAEYFINSMNKLNEDNAKLIKRIN